MTAITSTYGNDQFYPTPPELAKRMLAGIEWEGITTVLEPSAGKGNLIEAMGEDTFGGRMWAHYRYRRDAKIEVDCIEIDPYLRSILKYQFSEERKREIYKTIKPKSEYGNISESDWPPLYRTLDKTSLHIVHDDFLTFKPYKRYDLIVMNPPFKDGDIHLLHALNIQANGGAIVCLLNAETLRNPFANTRRELKKRLEEYGATIEYITDAFKDAERSADVEIAIVKVFIPASEERSDIFERLEKAAELEDFTPDITDLVVSDYIEAAVRHFNVECRAGIELIREWKALAPRIMRDGSGESYDRPILLLRLEDGRDYGDISVNAFIRRVRLKYWRLLFTHEKFMRKLTMKLRDEYHNTVDKMQDYDFSVFNIKEIMASMNAQVMTGVQSEILNIFDKLTAEHSWFPECKQNIHYYSGWRTNAAHKIGKKSIVPEYLQSSSWSRDAFDVGKAYGVLSDIEKVFDYLSGHMNREPIKLDISSALRVACEKKQTRSIDCTYFTVDIFKKGTVHIKYNCPELVERFNIYAARNRNWLPPNYGKVRYDDMTPEEKAVIDDFQGVAAYSEVYARQDYYLADPVRNSTLLTGGVDET